MRKLISIAARCAGFLFLLLGGTARGQDISPLRTPPERPAAFKTDRAYPMYPAGPYWPERALEMGVGGYATVDCQVDPALRLRHCRLAEQRPDGLAFGEATLRMAQRGWMTAGPLPADAQSPADGIWRFKVIFPPRKL